MNKQEIKERLEPLLAQLERCFAGYDDPDDLHVVSLHLSGPVAYRAMEAMRELAKEQELP